MLEVKLKIRNLHLNTLLILIVIVLSACGKNGCQSYASQFSCDFVEKDATYNVYYWKDISKEDPNDEVLIDSVKGLSNCRSAAINYSNQLGKKWNDRSYICMLVKDGKNLEKHRLLGSSIGAATVQDFAGENSQAKNDFISELPVDVAMTTGDTQAAEQLSKEDIASIKASVNALLEHSINDQTVLKFNYAKGAEGQAWLYEMSSRLQTIIPYKERREDLLRTVNYEAARAGLDPQLVLAVIQVESGFKQYEVSSAGARGLMQVMPIWRSRIGSSDHNLFLMRLNLRYGCTILRHYLNKAHGDLYRGLGFYNDDMWKPEFPNLVVRAWHKNWTYLANNISVEQLDLPIKSLGKQSDVALENPASATEVARSLNETVNVKYRGLVDLKPFQCEWITKSSVVKRLCYDAAEKYVIVNLTGTYYHYCEVPSYVIAAWRNSSSMGSYYNTQVKGQYDCRFNRVPQY